MLEKDLIIAFADACGHEEGYYSTSTKGMPTIPQRLHNPLDLRNWRTAANQPYPTLNGYVDFPACSIPNCVNPDHPSEVGWQAGRQQCRLNIVKRGLTFFEFFAGKPKVYPGFAPARDRNSPAVYAQAVLDRLKAKWPAELENVTINTVVSSLITPPANPT